jgi:hypothetical protein
MSAPKQSPKTNLSENFHAHMRVFAAAVLKYQLEGKTEEEGGLLAAQEANKQFPLSPEDIEAMKALGERPPADNLTSSMTDRQRYAFAHPATGLADMTNQAYARVLDIGGYQLKSLLTVNFMEGEASWHASISMLGADRRPMPVEQIPATALMLIQYELNQLLASVGDESKAEHIESASAFHLTKPLTEAERGGLRQRRAANRQNN